MNYPNQITYNIPEIFKDAFGIYARFPVVFLGDADPAYNPAKKSVSDDYTLGDAAPSQSALSSTNANMVAPNGVALWDRFAFKHPDMIGSDDDPLFYLPIFVTAEISDEKNIVLTDLIGNRGGTVKEMMSDGDKVIVFRGLIINQESSKAMPMDELAQINKLYDLKASLPVVSKFLNANNIFNVVFKSRQITGMEGYANIIKFEFTALSDTTIELEIKTI